MRTCSLKVRLAGLAALLTLACAASPAAAITIDGYSSDGGQTTLQLSGIATAPEGATPNYLYDYGNGYQYGQYQYSDNRCQGALTGTDATHTSYQDYYYWYGNCETPGQGFADSYCTNYDPQYNYNSSYAGCPGNPTDVSYDHYLWLNSPTLSWSSALTYWYYGEYGYQYLPLNGGSQQTVTTSMGPGKWNVSAYQYCDQSDYGKTPVTQTAPDYYGGGTSTYEASWYAGYDNCNYNSQSQFIDIKAAPQFSSAYLYGLYDSSVYGYAYMKLYGRDTDVRMEYGTDTTYGSSTASQLVYAQSNSYDSYSYFNVGGLQPGTQYHWRMVMSNDAGTTYGPDQTFTTTGSRDQTPPVITTPNNLVAEATAANGAYVNYQAPTATDNLDGPVAANCDHQPGQFALGTTTVHCTAADSHANQAQASFTVTVKDTTAPALTVPQDKTVEATSANGAPVDFSTSATDAVDGTDAVSCDHQANDTYGLGDTTVTCTAQDAAANKSTKTFKITVQDTTAPAIAAVTDKSAEATGPNGAAVSFDSPATQDAVDGNGTASCLPASGTTFALGNTTVTCSATDAHQNTSSKSFTVKVVDTTAPTLTLPGDINTTATTTQGAVASFTASASDLVSGSVTPSCSAASGAQFALGTTTVSCSATDGAGNTATGSFKVIVTYGFGGFVSPIKSNALSGNLGRTVPVKFTLSGASAAITNATGTVSVAKAGGTFAPATSTDGSAGVRYSDGQYIYNLSTKGLTAGAYTVRVSLGDGVSHDFTLTLA